MSYFAATISSIIISYSLLLPISSGNPLPQNEDKAFIEFVKGETFFDEIYETYKKEKELVNFYPKPLTNFHNFDLKKHLIQKYQAHLGFLFALRNHWKCEKIGKEFDQNEQKECHRFRQYVDILYEYLFQTAQKKTVVKPEFLVNEKAESLIGVLKALNQISTFYFDDESNAKFGKNLANFFKMDPCEPKLQNEKELDDLKKAIEDKRHEKFKLHLFSTEENPGKEFDKKLYNLMKIAKEEQKKELKALKKEEKSALEPLEKRIFDEKFSVYGDKFGILAKIAYEKLFL